MRYLSFCIFDTQRYADPQSKVRPKDMVERKDDDDNIIEEISKEEALTMIEKGIISGGMNPKVNTCINALEKGVSASVIVDGRVKHAILLELFTQHGAGTLIR